MRKIINSTYVSLDGVIERPHEWPSVGGRGSKGDEIQTELLLSCDEQLVGRRTYEGFVAESADDPNLIWVADLWTSEEEHAEALKVSEMRPFVEECMPLLEGMPEPISVRTAGGKVPRG